MSEVEKWQLKKLIKQLKDMKGSGTSVISQYIPPNTVVAQYVSRLQSEYGLADANIKSASNKKSVLEAITSATNRLKEYHKSPDTGLVVLAGNVYINGREKRMALAITPFKPINRSIYHCDSKFLLEPLEEILQDDQRYGFIIMDGTGCMFASIQGQQREILMKKTVELPKKQKKGGQSSQRFQRIRLEKRQAYLKVISELAVKYFISDNQPNVQGLVLAGHAEFKNDLSSANFLDPRLREKIIALVDISYGWEQGFNQAIDLVKDQLTHLELVREKKILDNFFQEIATDSGRFVFGPQETLEALQSGAVEKLLLDENFSQYFDTSAERFLGDESGASEEPLFVDYIAENYGKYGIEVHFITGQTGEGHQFIRGFGGLAAILRYPFTPTVVNEPEPASVTEPSNNSVAQEQEKVDQTQIFTEDDFM
jgi:peptide chain release factor subunit 1